MNSKLGKQDQRIVDRLLWAADRLFADPAQQPDNEELAERLQLVRALLRECGEITPAELRGTNFRVRRAMER